MKRNFLITEFTKYLPTQSVGPSSLYHETVAKVLGVSPSSGYELMHEQDFPVLIIGSRMVVPKEKFVK